MKKIIILISMIFVLFSCTNNNVENNLILEENEVNKIQIMTSIIPIASITNYIGWEFVEAESIVPAWVSPHGFDLKPSQMVSLEKADLIVYLWLEHIDMFLEKAINEEKSLMVYQWIELLEWKEHSHSDEDEHHDDEDEEHNDEYEHHDDEDNHSIDAHIWTSSENAIIIANKIADKLSELMPENKDYFLENLANFSAELNNIKTEFLEKNSEKNQKEFIVFHDAYNYLFEELWIDSDNKLVFQKNVLSDPNSKEMKELIDEIKLHWINIAFAEPQLNDSNLQKLANEYNLNVLTLNPLGSETNSRWYIENYKNNLSSLEYIYE